MKPKFFAVVQNIMDSKGKAVLALAEKVDILDDGKKFRFHLRDAKWSNGDDVTAEDFVFAWRRHCQVANDYAYVFGSKVACVKNADAVINGANPEILGVSAPNPKMFVVELDAPVPFFLSLMAFPTFYPVNEKFYNSLEKGTYGTSPETFLSNGAFKLIEGTPKADTVKLQKNDSYWNAERIDLKNLNYQVVLSSDNAMKLFKDRALDVVNIEGDHIEQVQNDSSISPNLKTYTSGYLYYISYNQDAKNHHKGELANKNLRLAISNAVDREIIVNNCMKHGAKETYTAVPVEFAPNIETGVFFGEDQKAFFDIIGFNLYKAKQHLEDAKKELGKEKFEFYFLYPNESGETIIKVVENIKEQIEKNLPEIKIILQPETKSEYLNLIAINNYDIALIDWAADYNDPMTFLALWTTEGSQGSEHWSNAEYDEIIAGCSKGELAENYDARWKAMHKAESIVLENAVIAPLYTDIRAVLVSTDVEGIEFHSVGVDRTYKNVKIQ